ncbi:ATP-binding protein [Kitasatospora sp. NBC_01560]|uniref:ATP-binding protein n=1 Tax=Kitasatospora sp. NBC_01560 TaxID=2975965 RepID=UPI00386E1E1E
MPGTPVEPTEDAVESCWLPRSRRSPAEGWRALEVLLADYPGGQQFADVGLLIVSELVTNAVVHGTPGGSRIQLVLAVGPTRLRIEVHDARADRGPLLRRSAPDDESGRGLLLVKSLSLRWGCCPRRGVGKIVWAEVAPSAVADCSGVEPVAPRGGR